jgi:hypothetical protein
MNRLMTSVTLEAVALEAMAVVALVDDEPCYGFSDGNVIF